MTMLPSRLGRLLAILLVRALTLSPPAAVGQDVQEPRAIVEGTVYDTLSHEALRLIVVRVAGTNISQLTDDRGRFRVELTPGEWRLELRAIGYEPAAISITAPEGTTRRDVYLTPRALELETITVTADRNPARDIIRRAIEKKRDVLAKIHDYRYDAYVKFFVKNLKKPQDSASSVMMITESRTEAYWERPDHYQERIVARRQSSNVAAENNLIGVGQILNFSRNRIDLGSYALVSPIADDALDHYDYSLLDTLAVGGRRVFRLAIAPRSEVDPLFIGMIDIADSSYDVLRIDVGVNAATRLSILHNLRYQQRLRDQGGDRWMPEEIRLSGEVRLEVPIPGLPREVTFEHLAELGNYRFDTGNPPKDLRYRILVNDDADRPDSATWAKLRPVPLSPLEQAAWSRIDSIERRRATLFRKALKSAGRLFAEGGEDVFHFNRVDGAYLGVGLTRRPIPWLSLDGKVGYGFGTDRVQYRLGGEVRVSEGRDWWIGASYHDETVNRSTFPSDGNDPTIRAWLSGRDPFDYYRERGFSLLLRSQLVGPLGVELRYDDARQSSLPMTTESLFGKDNVRPNPPIADGTLRSLAALLIYDSRPILRTKHADRRLPESDWVRVRLGVEVSAPSLIQSDFAFRRYWGQVERRQPISGWGVTTVSAMAGTATGNLPPQRYFAVDFGTDLLGFQRAAFTTLENATYSGSRAAAVAVEHDFRSFLFAKSGLPLIRKIPLTLSIHAGAFWTGFAANRSSYPGDSVLRTARTPYTELGFGVGNLTPFLAPFNLAAYFTWQLSHYPTHGFRFGLAIVP